MILQHVTNILYATCRFVKGTFPHLLHAKVYAYQLTPNVCIDKFQIKSSQKLKLHEKFQTNVPRSDCFEISKLKNCSKTGVYVFTNLVTQNNDYNCRYYEQK